MFKSRKEIIYELSNEQLVEKIRLWPNVDDIIIEEFCERAGLSSEYEKANGGYLGLIKQAADILGLDVGFLGSEIGNVQLPRFCFTVLPVFNEIVMIKNGRAGFFPTDLNTDSPWDNKKIVNKLNRRIGVTKQIVKAMECGAMFGWLTPAADPCMYDEDGTRCEEIYLEEDIA